MLLVAAVRYALQRQRASSLLQIIGRMGKVETASTVTTLAKPFNLPKQQSLTGLPVCPTQVAEGTREEGRFGPAQGW